MKKFLLCMMAALIGAAAWQNASARYILSDRVAANDIKAGDTIALQCGTQGNQDIYFLGVDETGKLYNVTPWSARSTWIVSEGPKNYKGEQTYYLQNLETQKYLGNEKSDPLNSGWSSPGTMVSDIEYAIPFAKHSAADSTELAEQYGPTWDDNSVVWSFARENAKNQFMGNCAYWGISTVRFWEYHDTNAWNAYRVFYQHDLQADLQALIDEISEAGIEYESGDDPGLYPQDKVDAFNQALEEALLISLEQHTDEEYQAAINKLKAAKEAVETSVNPITDGYYYIVSAYPEFVNKNGLEKAMTVNSATQLGWTTFNGEDTKQVFHITTTSSGNFLIQNYDNDRYINSAERAAASQKVLLSATPGYEQIIKPIGARQWIIYNTFSTYAYHPESHGNGTGQNGDIVSWNHNAINGMSTWYLRLVPQDVQARLPEIKAQAERNTRLYDLATEANGLWDKIVVYTVDSVGILTDADDDKEDSQRQVWSNAKDPNQGTYAALIDSTTSIFHSSWHPDVVEPMTKPHNLQFDFSDNNLSGFNVKMLQRCDSWGTQDRPTIISFYASNADDRASLTEEDAWTFIRQIDITDIWGNNTENYQNWATTPTIDLGKPYKYIRMDVVATKNSRKNTGAQYPFFSLAELQVYPVVLDETLSQYSYTEGLAPLADNMYALAQEAFSKVSNSTATEDDITALRDAIDQVRTLFADTTEVVKLAATLNDYASTAVIGDGIGETTQEAADALRAAIDEATGSSFTTPLVKSEIDEAMQKLLQAKADFLATVKMPEPGKWYFITSASSTDFHYNGGDETDPLPMANSALYADGPNSGDHIRYGLLADDGTPNYDYDPYSMWRLVEIEGAEGQYAFQNLGTGLYIGSATKAGASIYSAPQPTAYNIELLGNASFGFRLANADDPTFALMACLTGQHIEIGEAAVYGDGSWRFTEIDPEETELIVIDAFANNLIDVIALPYNLSGISDFNEDVFLYGIKKMTPNDDGTTTVELYLKDELAAGESGIIVLGDPEQECEDRELVIPFPTEFTDKATPVNGVHGMLYSESTPAGTAFSDGAKFLCRDEEVGIGANTGAIDASFYEGEVEGVETALTLVIDGLVWPNTDKTGDVNGDGEVNTSDVVAVYNFIIDGTGVTKEAADVNGDGDVNSTDVVAIYNLIISGNISGESAGSKSFYPMADGDDTEVTVLVGSTDNLAEIPVTVYLTNPTVDITAVEANL
ncbi:MAG: dockerin type I repeat-containing protein, partial [Bacteroidaceae bacterium]|nr:dockerin type I repeat-containing protein [Bacteroidaceae bacterium]